MVCIMMVFYKALKPTDVVLSPRGISDCLPPPQRALGVQAANCATKSILSPNFLPPLAPRDHWTLNGVLSTSLPCSFFMEVMFETKNSSCSGVNRLTGRGADEQ